MIVTEDEAKTKECCGPQAIVYALFLQSIGIKQYEPRICSGSACMAWKWEPTELFTPSDKGRCSLCKE